MAHGTTQSELECSQPPLERYTAHVLYLCTCSTCSVPYLPCHPRLRIHYPPISTWLNSVCPPHWTKNQTAPHRTAPLSAAAPRLRCQPTQPTRPDHHLGTIVVTTDGADFSSAFLGPLCPSSFVPETPRNIYGQRQTSRPVFHRHPLCRHGAPHAQAQALRLRPGLSLTYLTYLRSYSANKVLVANSCVASYLFGSLSRV